MRIDEIIVSPKNKLLDIIKNAEASALYEYYDDMQKYTQDFIIPKEQLFDTTKVNYSVHYLKSEFSHLTEVFDVNSQVTIMYNELLTYFSS